MGEAPFPGSDPSGGMNPPPPPPPPLPPHRLQRRRDDRVIAGVASGIAAYLGIDTVWVRVAFILVTVFGGVGILIYLIAWVAMPEGSGFAGPTGPGGPTGAAPRAWGGGPDARLVLGVGLLVVAALVLAGTFGFDQWGLFWGLALIAAGALLLAESRWSMGAVSGGTAPHRWAAAAPGGAGAAIDPLTGTGAAPAMPATTPFVPSGSRLRSTVPVGWLTTAVAILAVGVMALLDTTGIVTVSVGAGIGIVLLVIGAGLVAGTWLGRSSWLIVAGLILLPFAAAASLIHQPLSGGTGDLRFAPQSVADLRPAYHLAAGRLTVDLSHLQLSGAPVDVSVTDAMGQIVVIVPPGANSDVHASAGAGQLRILGHEEAGYQVSLQDTSTPSPGSGTLHLDVSVGMGQVTVEQSAAAAAAAGASS